MATLRYTEISQQAHPVTGRILPHLPTKKRKMFRELSTLCTQTYWEVRQYQELAKTNGALPTFNRDQIYWAVEETAARIAQRAIKMARHNIDNWPIIRNAVEKGFSDAKLTFGNPLPQQAKSIQKMVLSLLDRWATLWMVSTTLNKLSGEQNG